MVQGVTHSMWSGVEQFHKTREKVNKTQAQEEKVSIKELDK